MNYNNIFVGLIFGFVIGLACDLPRYFLEMDEKIEVHQIEIDSLENVIKSSIDTTVIRWPWGREEFYYFKFKES